MRKFAVFAILICCIPGFCGCTRGIRSPKSPIGVGIYKANNLYTDANYEECLKELKSLLAIDADDAYLHYNLGLTHARLNQYSQARDEYQKALRQRQNIPEIHVGLGDLYLKEHSYRKAMGEYQRALTMRPDSVEISIRLAYTYEALGKMTLAVKEYKSALRDKALPELYLNLGNIYCRLKRYEEAVSSYNKSLRLDPNLAEVYNNMGIVYEKKGDPQKALAAYQQATQKNYVPAYVNLGAFYRASGKYELAREQYIQALKIEPGYPEALLNLGILYDLYLPNPDEAIKSYRQYCRGNGPRSSEVRNWIEILQQEK